jgi:hypothetical protein
MPYNPEPPFPQRHPDLPHATSPGLPEQLPHMHVQAAINTTNLPPPPISGHRPALRILA